MYVHLTAAPNVDIIHMAWDRRVDPARDLLDRFRQLKQYHKGTYVTLNVHIDLIRDLEAYYARDSESGLP